jgi:hypothetical protein
MPGVRKRCIALLLRFSHPGISGRITCSLSTRRGFRTERESETHASHPRRYRTAKTVLVETQDRKRVVPTGFTCADAKR